MLLLAAVCQNKITGSSSLYGTRNSSSIYIDQTASYTSKGKISQIQFYYRYGQNCLYGIKPTYGTSSSGKLLGVTAQLMPASVKLVTGEVINKVDIQINK